MVWGWLPRGHSKCTPGADKDQRCSQTGQNYPCAGLFPGIPDLCCSVSPLPQANGPSAPPLAPVASMPSPTSATIAHSDTLMLPTLALNQPQRFQCSWSQRAAPGGAVPLCLAAAAIILMWGLTTDTAGVLPAPCPRHSWVFCQWGWRISQLPQLR